MLTKSSKRSNRSSRTNPDRLWLKSGDSYLHEQLRLALDGTEWEIEVLPDGARALPEDSDPGTASVLLVPASVLGDDPAFPVSGLCRSLPLLLVGSPTWLDVLQGIAFDDFLCDPWSASELRYRLRRMAGDRRLALSAGTLAWGPYWITGVGHRGPAHTAPLTPVQYEILQVLARSGREPVVRDVLAAVAGVASGHSRALDMQISRLRTTLSTVTAGWSRPPEIRSYRGRGYRLERS